MCISCYSNSFCLPIVILVIYVTLAYKELCIEGGYTYMGWVKEHKIQLTIFYARLGYVTLGTVSFTGIGPAKLAWHN